MSEEYLAPPPFRLTQVATRAGFDGNALAAVDTHEFPNGALAYVIEDRSLYSLDKFSTVTADGLSAIAAVGGGRWLSLVSSEQALYATMIRLVVATGTPNTGALVADTWSNIPSAGAGQFAVGAGASPFWTLAGATGVLTYSGPGRYFYIYGSITMATGAGAMGLSFSHSAAPILGTTGNSDFEAQTTVVADQDNINLSFIGSVAMLPTETIRGVIRNLEDGTSITVQRYQLALIPAP